MQRNDTQTDVAAETTGRTALWEACAIGNTQLVQMLLQRGAGSVATLPDKEGISPLHIACQRGHVDLVESLLEIEGIDVDVAGDTHTPLTLACMHGHLEVVEMLLDASCDPSKAPDKACSPAQVRLPTALPISTYRERISLCWSESRGWGHLAC